jgi:predicted O-methyltransferase YrrM
MMYSPLQLAGKYLRYYLTAANGKGHGIHSPFVFDFIIHVLNDTRDYPDYSRIEQLRRQLLRDETMLDIEDLGAGSALSGGAALKGGSASGGGAALSGTRARHLRSVADIARHAAKPKKLGQLLFRIARYYQPGTILELGTSLGLSTAYLAAGAPDAALHSIEGSAAVAAVAGRNLHSLGMGHAEVLTGHFDEVLGPLLERTGPVDLAFVDGNHRYEPTLRYFDTLVRHSRRSAALIFDDIHWSREMEQAWESIRKDARVYLTVDLFFIGVVFLREEFKVKQDFTIRF